MASVAKFDTWQAADGTNVARFSGGELQVWDGAAWGAPGAPLTPASISGGNTVTSGGYEYHTFLSSSTLTVSTPGEVELLLIAAGGGGGGGTSGGGGGAGGYFTLLNS